MFVEAAGDVSGAEFVCVERQDQISIDNIATFLQLWENLFSNYSELVELDHIQMNKELHKLNNFSAHAYLHNTETIWSITIRISWVNFQCNFILPSKLLDLLPGRVSVGEQELDTDSGHETLPGGCWPWVWPGVWGQERRGGGGGGGGHCASTITGSCQVGNNAIPCLGGWQHLAMRGRQVLPRWVGGGVVGRGSGGEKAGWREEGWVG